MYRQLGLVSQSGEKISDSVLIHTIGSSVEHYLLDNDEFHFNKSVEFTVSIEPNGDESVKLEITETE